MTDYVILRRDMDELLDDFPSAWYVVDGIYRASSAKRALDGAALEIPGDYVAIPARSWKPFPVKVESKTVVTVG